MKFRSFWFYGAVGTSVFFLVTTLIQPLNPSFLRLFDLDREGNLAALWSGMLMLVIALHAFDGWAAHKAAAPALARAWLMVALLMAGLSLDEVGEFHERVPSIGNHSHWLSLFPFAAVLGGMLAYALVIFFRSPGQRSRAWLLAIGFLLFVTVAIQVQIEAVYDWPGYARRLRTSVEEGTELLGMLFILRAAMGNTKGIFADSPGFRFPVFEAVDSLRTLILVAGFLGSFSLAYLSLFLESSHAFLQGGQPTAWLAAALFVLTAFAALRSSLTTGERSGWRDWALATLAVIACAGTTLGVQSRLALPLMMFLAAAGAALWYLDPRQRPNHYVPALALFAVVFVVALSVPGNIFVAYCTAPLVALGFFYASSARYAVEAEAAAPPSQEPGKRESV